jgi:hypothetical protein
MSPALTALLIATGMGYMYFPLYFYAAGFLVAYHFAGMYYIIKGPFLEIKEVKKKGIFSRK